MLKKSLLSATILVSLSTAFSVQAEDPIKKAFVDNSSHYVKLRYRLEHVDQSGFAKNAVASTLRSSLGYKTGDLYGFSGTLELQAIAGIGNERYNDTINGKTTHPTVADPELTAVTKAFITYGGIDNTEISVGRQQFNFDNMRFVNNNNWRQHHQTFDSVSLKNTSLADTTLNYVY